MEKDHTWQLLIETRPPVTGGSSSLLKRLLITKEPCLCFGCDVPLCSPAPPPPAPHPGWRQRSGGSRGGGSCRVGSKGAVRTRFLQGWAQGWLENGSLQLLPPVFPFFMKDNWFGTLCGVKHRELKLWDRSCHPHPILGMLCWTRTLPWTLAVSHAMPCPLGHAMGCPQAPEDTVMSVVAPSAPLLSPLPVDSQGCATLLSLPGGAGMGWDVLQ